MVGVNQVKQLISNYTMSRDFNSVEAKFIRKIKTTKKGYPSGWIVESDINEDEPLQVDLYLWLSWPLWNYRHLGIRNKEFKIGQDYQVTTKSGKVDTYRYFGDGIFSKLEKKDLDWLASSDTNYHNFNPFTIDFTSISKVGDIEIKPIE